MRIGMLADLYHPHLSGVTIHVDQLKRFLERAGHQVWTFAFGPEQPQDAARRIVRSPPLPLGVPYGGQRLLLGARLSPPARRMLDSMDLIHTHHPFLSGWLGLRCASRRGKPLVFTAHTRYDLHLLALAPRPLQAVGQALLRSYLRWFCARCTLVLSPSRAMRERLASWNVEGRFQVIPHGIDLNPFEARETGCRSQLGLAQDAKVLIFVGRLGKEKNLGVLLDVFETLARRWSGLHLLLLGGGPERARLERKKAQLERPDSVRFLGARPHEEVPRFLAASDLFVTPSRSEVLPISLIEAQAAGLPVVGFRAPGLNEVVADGHSGLLAGSTPEFEKNISRLLGDGPLRRQMSQLARVRSQRFRLESMGAKTLQAYFGLLNRE